MYHKRKRKLDEEEEDFEYEGFKRAKTYRNCGIILLCLSVVLSLATAQMIFDGRSFAYPGWTIYAYATYAFYRITMSIINLTKARKQDDLTVQAVRNINFAAAVVSILALQTAMLYAFGGEGVNISLFNTLTGSLASIITYAIAIGMIVKGNKAIKGKTKKDG